MIVDLIATDEQAAVRDSIAAVVAGEFPISRLQDSGAAAGRAEFARWSLLAELGLFGMAVAEANGGLGFTLAEEVTAARELGRGLVSPTVLATMAGAHVATGDLFAAIRDGRAKTAFANPLAPSDGTSGTLEVQLIDAGEADYVLLTRDEWAALYAKPFETVLHPALDDTIAIERAVLDLAKPVATLAGPGMARNVGLLLSAYLCAVSEGAMALAVDYAKVREQFGQAIGSFQAIKHYCADMARRSEAAVSQTLFATLDAMGRGDGDMFEVAAARLLAGDAATVNGRFGIQIHGGMGFTYEADAHFYLKRALLVSQIASSRRIEQIRVMASARLV